MELTICKPRRPWLAALLGLLGGPLGQIYAGRLLRSFVLWVVGSLLLPIWTFMAISLPVGGFGILILILVRVGLPLYLMVDAYVVAKRHRDAPLSRFQRWWVYLLAFLVFFGTNHCVATMIRMHVAEAFVIPTRSMAPTMVPGDRVLVDKLWYRPSNMKRNDIAVFRRLDSAPYAMRVVGLPGDTIQMVDEQVLLNGEAWSDSYAFLDASLPQYPELANFGPIEVPADAFFVLGDNRRRSADSRINGPISFSDLHGKACMIYWSQERRFADARDTSNFESGPIAWSRIGTRLD